MDQISVALSRCLLGKFSHILFVCFCCCFFLFVFFVFFWGRGGRLSSATLFFKIINFFDEFFQEYCKGVKKLGSRTARRFSCKGLSAVEKSSLSYA